MQETMKAWQYTSAAGGLEKNLYLTDTAVRPSPTSLAKDQILVEVQSMSLNPVDYKVPEMGALANLMIRMPASPGRDFCGRVVATHTINDSLQIGERVFGRLGGLTQNGSLGQFIVASSAGCVPLPEHVDADDAAALGTAALTAYQSIVPNIKHSSTKPRVFINGGSGGTGTWAIQIAKTLGAHVTTSCSTGNVALCKQLGADEVLDYKKEDICAALQSIGQNFDLVVDNVALSPALYQECENFLKPGGLFVQVGASTSLVSVGNLVDRMLRPSFLGGGTRPFSFLQVKNRPEDFIQLGSWLSEGKIKAVIEKRYPFADALTAIEKLKGGHTVGKLVVHVAEHERIDA